ncbi:MAG TPA: hypothetical protein VEY12_10725 [Thermoplasmata archaeon]|nr:hypothetical protein [Thermoplasmata archaeon]
MSPEVLAGWDALHLGNNSGVTTHYHPPDVIVSAGPTHVVEMVNLLMGVYTKTGTRVRTTNLTALFHSGGDFISDPKVQFDPATGRWFATVTDVTATQVLLAVSASSDPTGSWRVFSVPSAATGHCLDQPILGVGTSTVIVSVNVFSQPSPSSCTSPYLGAQYWVVNKNDLVTNATSPATFASVPDPTEFSIHPAQIQGTSSVDYMVSVYWPGAVGTSSTLHLFTVSGTPPSAVTVTVTSLSMATAAVAPPAPQNGSTAKVDTSDLRVSDAAWSGGSLWLGFDEACRSDPTRACIRLAEIGTNGPSLLQDFDLSVPGKFAFYPGLRMDGTGSLAVVFGYSSPTDYPGIMATGRLAGDPPSTVQAVQVVAAGSGPESPSGCVQTCRYGDYFGAGLDPTNASVVWLAGELGTPTGWSTHVFAVSVKAELTFSYRLSHAGSGYSPPAVTYVHGGVAAQQPFSTSPTTALADPGTAWSVSAELAGSSVARGEVWVVNSSVGAPATAGVANRSLVRSFDYFHQYAISFGFQVLGGGGYGISPQLNGTVLGLPVIITTPQSLFLDAGSPYEYPRFLSGSSTTERWETLAAAATVSGPGNVSATYYHQVRVTFEYSGPVGALVPPPNLTYPYLGSPARTPLNATVWVDARSPYAYDASVAAGDPGARWAAGRNRIGSVTASGTVVVAYRKQFLLSVTSVPAALATSVSGAGWYDAGASATLDAAAPTGWRFGSWGDDASGTALTATLLVLRPMNVTAMFEAGLTITAGDGGSVAYAYGSVSGTVPAGTSATIYVPVGTSVTLTGSPSSWVQAFRGWSGASSETAASTTVLVSAPGVVTGTFGVNLLVVDGVPFVVVVIALVAVVVWRRRRRSRPPV